MSLTRSEALAWLNRWKEVDALALSQLRRMTADEKLNQLASLMQSARHLAWPGSEADEDEAVRELWQVLRRRSGPA